MPARVIARYLGSPLHSWSIGIPGAIAEFMYDADEAIDIRIDGPRISAVTGRGAMQISIPPATESIAYEGLGSCMQSWSQAVAFCDPAGGACFPATGVLSEQGEDRDAPLADARREILFDLGLGSRYLRFCVRTGDARLLAALRTGAGRSIFDPGNPAFPALREASPTRVIESALGRIEVYQGIPANGAESPAGPHTHLLPALLGTDPPGTGIALPRHFIAALTLYPQHPLFDKHGNPTSFNRAAHDDFQGLLARYGDADYLAAKARFSSTVSGEILPGSLRADCPPHEQLAYDVTKNQLPYLHAGGETARPA